MPNTQPSSSLSITREQVRRELGKRKVRRKAVGLDNINPGLLRHCARPAVS